MAPIEKNWKYYLGLSLFVYSLVPMCTAELVFLLPLSTTARTSVAAVYLATGEVSFLAAAALLGKPFIEAVKAKVKGFFLSSRKGAPPKPIGRTRHYVGVSLFFISFLPYAGTEGVLLFGDPGRMDARMLLGALFLGDAIFVASLLVLGGEFWERLKKLFQWPGNTVLSPAPTAQSARNTGSPTPGGGLDE